MGPFKPHYIYLHHELVRIQASFIQLVLEVLINITSMTVCHIIFITSSNRYLHPKVYILLFTSPKVDSKHQALQAIKENCERMGRSVPCAS